MLFFSFFKDVLKLAIVIGDLRIVQVGQEEGKLKVKDSKNIL